MDKSLVLGLIGGAFALAAAIVALIGVIYKTQRDFQAGNRAADINDRAGQHKENAELRAEIDSLWERKRALREMNEAKDEEIRTLKDRLAWHEKNRAHSDNVIFTQDWRLQRVLEAAAALGWIEPTPPKPSVPAPPPEPIPDNGPDLTKLTAFQIADVS